MNYSTIMRRSVLAVSTLVLAGCAAQMRHRTGMRAFDAEDYPAAVKELAHASQLAPDNVAYRRDWLRARENATNRLLQSAAGAMARGSRDAAQQSFQKVLQYKPENSRALAGLDTVAASLKAGEEVAAARNAATAGDVTRAGELVSSALKRASAHPDALALQAELAEKQQHNMTARSLGSVYKKAIKLEFRDASLKIVFDALSRTTGINFIFDRDVKADQRTTVFLKQTSLDDAIDVILSTGQLEKKVLNASRVLIYPGTPAKLKEYQDLVVRAFYLANIDPKQAATMLKTVLKLKDVYVDDKYNLLPVVYKIF